MGRSLAVVVTLKVRHVNFLVTGVRGRIRVGSGFIVRIVVLSQVRTFCVTGGESTGVVLVSISVDAFPG